MSMQSEGNGKLRVFLILSLVLGILTSTGCVCRRSSNDSPHLFSYRPLPTQTPIALSPGTVDQFVTWVLTMNSTQVDDVVQQIALVAGNNSVVDVVASKLSFTQPGSIGHQLIYLSILGQMRNERAIAALRDYVYSTECHVVEQLQQRGTPASATTVMDVCAMLKSHAINMISFINTQAAQEIVLQTIANHPSKSVRMSAMDSFLYNAGDSPAAIELVTRYARPEERLFVGLPRLDPSTSLKEFDRSVAEFYRAHPEQLPPAPPIPKEHKQ